MTPDQIKTIAKQAGGTPYTNRFFPDATACAFGPNALEEFVRLVREQAFKEAASLCAIQGTGWLVNPKLDGCGGAIALNNAAHDIRGLK